SITIKSSSGLSDDEIEDMVKDAEENAEADKQRREEIDLRNEADQLVFTTDKTIKDLGEKVTDEEKQKAEDAKEALKQALEGEEVQQLSVKLYEQMAQEQQAEGEGSEASGEDDVVDADYQEVDDDKDPADENK